MTEWRKLTRAEWKAWHANFKRTRGFPRRGFAAGDGARAAVNVGATVEYAVPVELDASDVRVPAWGEMVALGSPCAAPVYDVDGVLDVVATREADKLLDAPVI